MNQNSLERLTVEGESPVQVNPYTYNFCLLYTSIQARLKNSLKELEYESKYDRVIINDEIEQACNDLISIIENGVR